jgi:CheY-like chemotaxis protein
VTGDSDRLQQVMWNLLSNAIKFTSRGGRVEVRLGSAEGSAEIQVRDTGVGIRADFLPYVFDRFRQAESATTRSHGGLGLGLSIVRHLVEMHGGTVEAQSPGEGKGAVFTVRLPVRAVEPPVRPATEPSREPAAAAAGAATVDLGGLRVLVVDDEEDARDLLCHALEAYGAHVQVARSAAEALAAIDRERPDVLVSDVGMPGVDGYSLMRRVRASESLAAHPIPAAALTAYARPEDRVLALAAGYELHLAKPIDPLDLAAAVAKLAGRRAVPL